MTVEVLSNAKEIKSTLVKLPASTAVFQELRRGMQLAGAQWQGKVRRNFLGATGVSAFGVPPGKIHYRSGALHNSILYSVTDRGSSSRTRGLRLVLYTAGVPYARAQEFGAVIKPKKKMLAIPGTDNVTAGGRVRYSNAGAWFKRAEKNGKIRKIESRKGGKFRSIVVLFSPTGDDGTWKHMWTLVSKVTIKGPKSTGDPSRLKFHATWKELRKEREAMFGRQLRKGVAKYLRGV